MQAIPDKQPALQKLLRASEVAEILDVSKAFVYQLIQRGLIRSVRIGTSRRIRMEDLLRFIEENSAA
ncbi:MAG TPA: helix-turn-helix domain-containing protein [Anaerolineales bacterium]|nr:helix-turn-helix domain-containing protein [Anaerolineales bacterium]